MHEKPTSKFKIGKVYLHTASIYIISKFKIGKVYLYS